MVFWHYYHIKQFSARFPDSPRLQILLQKVAAYFAEWPIIKFRRSAGTAEFWDTCPIQQEANDMAAQLEHNVATNRYEKSNGKQ